MAIQRLSRFGLELSESDRAGNATDPASSATRLRVRNALTAGRDEMLSLGLVTHAILYSELLILHSYLLDDYCSLPTALVSFTTELQHLLAYSSPSTLTPETLFRQSFARLIYTHVTQKRPYAPSTIRSFLAESIAKFPNNTIFLSLYAWNEARFRIDDRVRGIMRDTVFSSLHQKQDDDDAIAFGDITPHVFAIYTDLKRGLIQGSNHNAIRGTFERALRSREANHCAWLWKWYFMFEVRNGGLGRAKEVFWRALGQCPWDKGLYLLGVRWLAKMGLGERELRGVYDLMVQREIRVCCALE
ncbi:MAG: hypothetical protein Q9174_007178 [Haloplaca sp. 1 TL-2023]